MEINHIVDALRSTTTAEGQEQASDYLKKISSLIGFPQILLRIIEDEQQESAVRQAAVIYLKNIIHEYWEVDKEHNEGKWELSEQDKITLRQQLILTTINSPEPIKVHLCTSIQSIMRRDFPEKWPGLTGELLPLLTSQDSYALSGALQVLYRLCKIFEYKRQKEKTPLVDFMCKALPILRERLATLIPNQTAPSSFLQKQILKIFYCLIQFSLNAQMFPLEEIAKWLKLFMEIVQQQIPTECDAVPEDERAGTIWWKCKKWTLKTLQRIFERYGNKGNVDKPYTSFAEEYSKTFALPVVESLLVNVLNDYINGKFVSECVLYFTLNHLSDALNQAQVWLVVKPKFEILLKNVIFPLLQFSKDDDELWSDDPEEYLKYKYDVYEDLHQPSSAASTLLQIISKRKGIMDVILKFIMANLTPTATPHQVDGALHMIAVVSSRLMKCKDYKKDVEKLIDAQVTPRTVHESRFVRQRACYVLHYTSEIAYKNMKILERVVNALIHRLKEDTELPVKVEAAIAIQSLLNDQATKGVAQMIRPHIRDVLIIVLRLVAETHVDDLPTVVDSLVENFEEDVIPIAYEVTVELVGILNKMIKVEEAQDGDQEYEDHTVGAMGILTTLETILSLLEEHPEIIRRVEPVVRNCIVSIFESYCENYFEEALSLTHTLIVVHISPEMWQVFDLICKAFDQEDTSFFSECMPVFHAFLTVDTQKFLESPERIHKLLSLSEKVISEEDCDENTKAHAAKMLEVFLLQCHGHVSQLIPDIMRLALSQIQKPENETICLNVYKPQLLVVLIAALYTDFQLATNIFGQIRMDQQLDTFEWFVRELYRNKEHFEGIHDRKMIIWLLCRLLSDGIMPNLFHDQTDKLMEWMLTLFTDLQRCIKELAERTREDDSDEDEEESSDEDERMNGELKDSDDDVDEENMEYLETLEQDRRQRRSRRKSSTNKSMEDPTAEGGLSCEIVSVSDTDSEDHHSFQEETDFESFTTPVDEQDEKPGLNVFVLFKRTLEVMKQHHPPLFSALCEQHMGPERIAELNALMDICIREENLERSKQLAQAGGYSFDASQPVPNSFKFA